MVHIILLSQRTIAELVACSGICTVAVGIVSGFNNGRPKKTAQDQMIYRRPKLRNVFFGTGGLTMLLALFLTWGSGGFWVIALQSCLAMPLFLFLSGPEEMRINLSERTYQTVTGWPMFPRKQSGMLNEALGVYVLSVRSDINLVKIAWKDTARPSITLAQSSNKDWAMRLAQEATEALYLNLLTDYQHVPFTQTRP